MVRPPLILFLLMLGSLCRAAPLGPGAAELDQGFFCALKTVSREPAQDTVSGSINLVAGAPAFIGPGPEVPARIGIGFGVMVRAAPGMAGPTTVQVEHPPMGPNAVTRQSWTTVLSGTQAQYLGYTFELPYELLPGRWTMSARANGRAIYEVSFNVVNPAQMPWITCGEQVPLS